MRRPLARHEQAHDFGQRTQVKIREPAGHFNHLRGKPALLIDRGNDVLQHNALRGLCILMRPDDKALDPAIAKRHKDTPAGCNLAQMFRHTVRIRLRYALDGDIHKNISGLHRLSRPLPDFPAFHLYLLYLTVTFIIQW